jgi:hypothetical protein
LGGGIEEKNPTLYSDGATLARTRVGSFAAPLDRRKSRTSKLVSVPAFAAKLQKRLEIIYIHTNPNKKNKRRENL